MGKAQAHIHIALPHVVHSTQTLDGTQWYSTELEAVKQCSVISKIVIEKRVIRSTNQRPFRCDQQAGSLNPHEVCLLGIAQSFILFFSVSDLMKHFDSSLSN